MENPSSLIDFAYKIVKTRDLCKKVSLAKKAYYEWNNRSLSLGVLSTSKRMPSRPGRPENPKLLSPKLMPKRSMASETGRIALLHSIAHIELNAIDMTWDLIGRFGWSKMPCVFYDNWVQVGFEEAKHFDLLNQRLALLNTKYGDLPAHDGLWQAAQDTGEDLLARVAIVPLVLEARGLDVTPAMIEKFQKFGDNSSAEILSTIYNDEKYHVAYGFKWFRYLCEKEGREPEPTFQRLVQKHFRGKIKPPFNDAARSQAGLTPGFYKPLSALGSVG